MGEGETNKGFWILGRSFLFEKCGVSPYVKFYVYEVPLQLNLSVIIYPDYCPKKCFVQNYSCCLVFLAPNSFLIFPRNSTSVFTDGFASKSAFSV